MGLTHSKGPSQAKKVKKYAQKPPGSREKSALLWSREKPGPWLVDKHERWGRARLAIDKSQLDQGVPMKVKGWEAGLALQQLVREGKMDTATGA